MPQRLNYKEEDLRKVLSEIRQKEADGQKVNISDIAKTSGIPRSTIRSRLSNPNVVARGHVFTEKQEEDILEYIKQMQKGTSNNQKRVIGGC